MSASLFCDSCGKSVPSDAKFCEHCGAALPGAGEPAAAGSAASAGPAAASGAPPAGGHAGAAPGGPPPGPSGHSSANPPPSGGAGRSGGFEGAAADRIESITPGATELADALAARLKTPAVATALIGGAIAAAACFVVGLVFGVIFSDNSALGAVDSGKGIITAAFAQMLNFIQVGYSSVGKLGPAIFLIFPIGACAVAAATQAHRTRGLRPEIRLAAGAGVGVVFGVLMLIPALAAGSLANSQSDPSVFGAVMLGIIWGMIGGLAGTYVATRGQLGAVATPGALRNPTVSVVTRTVLTALRPLGVALIVLTLIGTFVWAEETLRSKDLRGGEPVITATVDDAAYALEHGMHWTELGFTTAFRAGLGGLGSTDAHALPVPVNTSKLAPHVNSNGVFRVFTLSHGMAIYTFIPLLILVIGIPLLLALYAGFAVARLNGAPTPLHGAAWGAVVGPVWALSMVILNALIGKIFFGHAQGDSVFGRFLLFGLVVGAIGGLIATQSPAHRAGAPGGRDTLAR